MSEAKINIENIKIKIATIKYPLPWAIKVKESLKKLPKY